MAKSKTGKSRTKAKLREVGKKTVDQIEQTRTFEPFLKPQVGERIHIFHKKGEFIEGILGSPLKNFQRSSSYPITRADGTVIEFFGNRLLHQLIRKGELIGKRVRIQYIGRQATNYGGHWRKIYRVFEVS